MEKILSFIIPSYNCERFLDKCISSMLQEDILAHLDIIIVNDGSKDSTAEIAEKYCSMHPDSIRLISQDNKGHGGALNTGCAAAVGKYLKVIDADDWVETSNLPEYIAFLQNCDSDVVLTHHYTLDISNGEVKKWMSYPGAFGKTYRFDEIMSVWNDYSRSLTFHGITYKTAFYQQNTRGLSEHIFYEDHEYATIPCCLAHSVTPLDLFIYNYRIGDVEQSVSEINQLKRLSHMEAVLNRLLAEYPILSAHMDSFACDYYCRKVQGVLLAYLTTLLLVMPNRKEGRQLSDRTMQTVRQQLPKSYELSHKQYRIFRLMNQFGFRKKTWDKILHSALYRKVQGNHDFN